MNILAVDALHKKTRVKCQQPATLNSISSLRSPKPSSTFGCIELHGNAGHSIGINESVSTRHFSTNLLFPTSNPFHRLNESTDYV